MKRLVATGFPDSAEPWKAFLAKLPGDAEFLKFADYFRGSRNSSLVDFRNIFVDRVQAVKPDSILLHDFSVTIGLLGLLKLEKVGGPLPSKLTLFNGAFDTFSILKSPHPIRIQFASWKDISKAAKRDGFVLDNDLAPHFPMIKKLYRGVALASLLGIFRQRMKDRKFPFEVQLIGSKQDPFIPRVSLDALINRFCIQEVHWTDYPHFPYLGDADEIVRWVEHFEGVDR